MAESAVTFVLNKLARYLQEEEDVFRSFRGNLVWIKEEMERMQAFLRVADSMEEDGTDEEIKVWVRQIRNAALDIEDVLDELKLQVSQPKRRDGGVLTYIHQAVKKLTSRRDIASEIISIKSKIIDISQGFRRYRFKLEAGASSAGHNICYYRRGDALLIPQVELVGIEGPKQQLLEWLLEEDLNMKVISVLGMGGLGKTSLVKQVYDDVKAKSHVWINVSQSFKLEELLKDIIRQLFEEMNLPIPARVESMDGHQLKGSINEFLEKTRYIIILDDVWKVTDWDGFKYAFSNNNLSSRVILTTRVKDVADKSSIEFHGHVYNLKPLSSEESWSLFCTKTFQTNLCPHHLIEMCKNILKRCGGLPLAIAAISGVLATKDTDKLDEWDMVHRSLGAELENNDGFMIARKILSLGYSDLPYYLKCCFLYLSVFPEDYLIERMRLVRLWIAEGFIEVKHEYTQEEVANGYLNELVNRSMIQV